MNPAQDLIAHGQPYETQLPALCGKGSETVWFVDSWVAIGNEVIIARTQCEPGANLQIIHGEHAAALTRRMTDA